MSTVIEETPVTIQHNHKPNFGRYVADCPKCQEKHPDGPPVRAKKEKPAEAAPPSIPAVAEVAKSVGLTEDALMRIMIEANKALGAELRKPDPEVEAEKQAQKIRLQIAKDHERQVIAEAEAQKQAIQAVCAANGHKQNGGLSQASAVSGQMCTGDGLFHWICVTCQMTGTRKPRPDEMQMGAG